MYRCLPLPPLSRECAPPRRQYLVFFADVSDEPQKCGISTLSFPIKMTMCVLLPFLSRPLFIVPLLSAPKRLRNRVSHFESHVDRQTDRRSDGMAAAAAAAAAASERAASEVGRRRAVTDLGEPVLPRSLARSLFRVRRRSFAGSL